MKKSIRTDEGVRFLRSYDLICHSVFPCSLEMMMTLFWNVWAVCSCVAKHNMEAWGGEHHSPQKTHLTGCSLNCLLANDWREMWDNTAERASPNHLNFVVAPYEGFIAISQSTSMFGLACGFFSLRQLMTLDWCHVNTALWAMQTKV